jgi:hypothetical protein
LGSGGTEGTKGEQQGQKQRVHEAGRWRGFDASKVPGQHAHLQLKATQPAKAGAEPAGKLAQPLSGNAAAGPPFVRAYYVLSPFYNLLFYESRCPAG